MKKHSKLIIAMVLVVASLMGILAFAVSCGKEKKPAVIEAEDTQTFIYDGQVHNVEATLNHDETQLAYSPQQGYTEIGTYNIEVSAAETEHYNATSKSVKLVIRDPKEVLNMAVFNEAMDKMAGCVNFNTRESIAIDFALDTSFKHQDVALRAKDWGYKVSVKGNIDFAAPENSVLGVNLYDPQTAKFYSALYMTGKTELSI